ncbi:hypothetical protein BB558_000691 [Smittium angustum]|uniref:Cyclin-like domain-containing protein n=1 Tax=Smittium angustum TaxID=133377 RepID=A0A2U1JDE7_SMIAN|nr:hypothetical protein BB558_000691 [Smittium angustum]
MSDVSQRLTLQNPVASYAMLADSPSKKVGINEQMEESFRYYGCRLIQSAGILLKLPQVVMASAMVIYQRVYCISSFKELGIKDAVLGALFLATKTEESLRRTHEIISSVDIVIKMDRGYPLNCIDIYGQEYYDDKSSMFESEMVILKNLGFNVQVQLPHNLAINYLQCLGLAKHENIPQTAWNYINDGLWTKAYITFQPQTIACASILLATRKYGVCLPDNPAWYKVFDANKDDIDCVAKMILQLYSNTFGRVIPVDNRELKMYFEGSFENHVNNEKKKLIKQEKEKAERLEYHSRENDSNTDQNLYDDSKTNLKEETKITKEGQSAWKRKNERQNRTSETQRVDRGFDRDTKRTGYYSSRNSENKRHDYDRRKDSRHRYNSRSRSYSRSRSRSRRRRSRSRDHEERKRSRERNQHSRHSSTKYKDREKSIELSESERNRRHERSFEPHRKDEYSSNSKNHDEKRYSSRR